jgi:integrase
LQLVARTTLESLMRLSEVLGLRLEDIGPSCATVVQSKNGRSRRVPLTADLREALILRSQGKGFVFGQGADDQSATAAACSVAYARLMRPLHLA